MADKENKLIASQDLQSEVIKYFTYLFRDFGFKFVLLPNDYQGNVLVAQSAGLRFRFIRDRADFFLDVGYSTRPDEWISFYKLLDKIGQKGGINKGYKIINKIRPIGDQLIDYLPLIKKYFSEHA